MANYVKIATIGAKPLVEKPENYEAAVERMIAHWRGRLEQVLPDQPDLIVVPECCDRFPAYTMDERLAYYRYRGDRVRDFFAQVAREHGCYIAYAAVRLAEDDAWRNSMQMIDRGGQVIGCYNKNHLVITETTQGGILCGGDAPIIECDFGRVGGAICFDLNFEPLRKKYQQSRPDLILFPSMYHGGLMQGYWAYACQAWLVSAVAGQPSGVINPVGHKVASTTNYFDYVTSTINLDYRVVHLDWNWDRLKAMKNKYGPKAAFFDPGFLGAVLLTSESEDFTADDLIEEFQIELLDDYFARSLAHHGDPANIEPMPCM